MWVPVCIAHESVNGVSLKITSTVPLKITGRDKKIFETMFFVVVNYLILTGSLIFAELHYLKFIALKTLDLK